MKKLVICGDSFNAVSKTLSGTHYSELLADRLGWQLMNYARRGCSNGGIRLQIQEAIKQKADFVIVVPTGWDRMEIPVRDNFYRAPANTIKKWGNLLQDFLLDKSRSAYDPDVGINNINYDPAQTDHMIFETIFSLAENCGHEYRTHQLTNEKTEAIQQYINHIYDSGWKQQIDKWIISDGVCQLHGRSIPFSIERGMLWKDREDIIKSIPSFIPKEYIRQDNELIGTGCSFYPLKDTAKDPGYHSEPEAQKWIADLYERLIKDNYRL